MLRRGTKIRWASFFRPQRLEREQLRLLKRAGLYALELGTDAADDTTLAELGKGFTFDDVLRSAQACADEELLVAHYVMFGGPGETPETTARGLANLKRLPDAVVFAFVGVRIFPSTRLRLRAIEEGVIARGRLVAAPLLLRLPRRPPAGARSGDRRGVPQAPPLDLPPFRRPRSA